MNAATLAQILREAAPADGMPAEWSAGCDSAREYIARRLAERLAAREPGFDRVAFFVACGVDPEMYIGEPEDCSPSP